MVRLMTAARLGIVALLALVIVSATGTFSFSDVSAAGRAGVSRMPALFKDNGNKGNNGNGNGNAGQDADDEGDTADDGDGHEKKGKKAKKDKHDKSDKAKDQADDSGDEDEDGKASANFDCDDVEGMIEYLMNRNMNGAIHANENGADNAAAGALNKCMEHEPENGDDSDDGTPVAEDDGTPVAVDGTPVGEDDADEDDDDKPVTVNVEIDEDGNGVIEYDLDGDGEVDLTMIVEDGKVTSIVEAGADDGTPEASPEAA